MARTAKVQQRSSFEPITKPLQRFAGLVRRHHGADLHRDRGLGMTEDLHRLPRVHVQDREHRSTAAASVMDGDAREAGASDSAVPGPVEIPRVDRYPVASGEHEVGIVPGVACRCAVLVALLLTELQRSDTDVWQWKNGRRRIGLRLAVSSWRLTRCNWPCRPRPRVEISTRPPGTL
jgi:hypothetical protein